MLALLLLASVFGEAAELPRDARIEAQRAIKRARYAFVIGNSKPSDAQSPHSTFEKRVARHPAEKRVLESAFAMTVTPAVPGRSAER